MFLFPFSRGSVLEMSISLGIETGTIDIVCYKKDSVLKDVSYREVLLYIFQIYIFKILWLFLSFNRHLNFFTFLSIDLCMIKCLFLRLKM